MFCERAFQDNKSARKKHVQSTLHKQNRNTWYRQFKDKRQKLEDELAKPKLCSHYAKTGFCSFGESCRYRHLRDDEIADIKKSLENDSTPTSEYEKRTVQTWLLKRNAKSELGYKESKTPANTDIAFSSEPNAENKATFKDLKTDLNLAHLPPSLQAPPAGGWIEIEDVTWG